MLSILGATHEDMEAVLKGLGYRGEPRKETEIAVMRERATALAAPAAPAEAVPVEASAESPVNAGTEAAPEAQADSDAQAAPEAQGVQAAEPTPRACCRTGS